MGTFHRPLIHLDSLLRNHHRVVCARGRLSFLSSISPHWLSFHQIRESQASSCLFRRKTVIVRMASQTSNVPAIDDEDLVGIDDVEQLCNRMAKYEPCFRLSLIQHHLKRFGISCNDERLVKFLSLSFETAVRTDHYHIVCLATTRMLV